MAKLSLQQRGQFLSLTFDPITSTCILLYFTYYDFKLRLTKKLTLNFNRGGGVQFSTLKFDPKEMFNFTYCDFLN